MDILSSAKHSLEFKALIDELKNRVGDVLTESELQLNLNLNNSLSETNSLKNLNEINEMINQLFVFLNKYNQTESKPIDNHTVRSLLKDIEKAVHIEEVSAQEQLLKFINTTISSMIDIQEGFCRTEKIRNILNMVLKIKQII